MTHTRSRTDSGGRAPDSSCAAPGADLALVREVLAGVPRADDRLLERLKCLARFLSALNARHGSAFDEHEIADLVQDTLIVVWRKLDHFHGPEGLESWVLRIARFEFQNAIRKKARRFQLAGPLESGADVAAPGDAAQSEVERQTLAQVLGDLAAPAAETVRLKHYSGLTFEEIGTRMSCTANTAKTRYYRALSRLAKALEATEA